MIFALDYVTHQTCCIDTGLSHCSYEIFSDGRSRPQLNLALDACKRPDVAKFIAKLFLLLAENEEEAH